MGCAASSRLERRAEIYIVGYLYRSGPPQPLYAWPLSVTLTVVSNGFPLIASVHARDSITTRRSLA